MGYTHYYTFKTAPKGQSANVEKAYQKAIQECNKIAQAFRKENGGVSGYSAYTSKYGGLKINGSESAGMCEDFTVREHFSQNESFNFCKTRQYQYDTVVVACLIVLSHRLGNLIEVSSDGSQLDWVDGLELARSVLGLKSLQIPKSIRGATLKVA